MTARLLTLSGGQQQLITVPLGINYVQSAEPSSPSVGQTWLRIDGSSMVRYLAVWDGNLWRLQWGPEAQTISVETVAGATTVSGISAQVVGTIGRRFNAANGATGTARALFNQVANSIVSLGGLGNASTLANFSFASPLEFTMRLRAGKTGTLRWYATNAVINGNADLSDRGFGVNIDLSTGAAVAQLHNGTTLYTQSLNFGSSTWYSGATTPLFDVTVCWDGNGKLGVYINNVYGGAINQAISQPAGESPFYLHVGYTQTSAPIAQTIDLMRVHTIGNPNS